MSETPLEGELAAIALARDEAIADSRCIPPPQGCGRSVLQRVINPMFAMTSMSDQLSLDEIRARSLGFANGSALAAYRRNGLCQSCQGRYDEEGT